MFESIVSRLSRGLAKGREGALRRPGQAGVSGSKAWKAGGS